MGARWTDYEDEAIRMFYPEHGPSWEGEGLRDGWKYHLAGRTRTAIQSRACKLGVNMAVHKPPEGHKRCSCCKLDKPVGDFGVLRKSHDGLNCYCRNCNKLLSREYRRSQRS